MDEQEKNKEVELTVEQIAKVFAQLIVSSIDEKRARRRKRKPKPKSDNAADATGSIKD